MSGEILQAFITLFLIMDPFSSLPVFLGMAKDIKKDAAIATISAAIALFSFILLGNVALGVLDLTLGDVQIAGGIILLGIAVQYALGMEIRKREGVNLAVVLIGVPLISGPGTLTASMVLVNTFGLETTLIAGTFAIFLTFVILLGSQQIKKLLGEVGIEIISRIFSLLLAAMAVSFIRKGLGGSI